MLPCTFVSGHGALKRRGIVKVKTLHMLFAWLAVGAALPALADRGPLRMVAHRGDYPDCPEGSRPAYAKAVERGADIVKLDLHDTKDHVIVTSHDDTLKRTMGWDVRIEDVTYAEILEHEFLSVGEYAHEKIVPFSVALGYAAKIKETWLDFKHFTPDFAERVLAEVKRAGIDSSRLMIATYSQPALSYMKERHPEIRRIAHVHYVFDHARKVTMWSFGGKTPGVDVMAALPQIRAYRDRCGLWGINIIEEPETTAEFVAALKRDFAWVSIAVVKDVTAARRHARSLPDGVVTKDIRMARPIFAAAREAALNERSKP